MEKHGTVTAALEDYLEAILNLCRFDKAARSRDIAEALNVHKSTVTAALKSLKHMQLINYSPYEAVTLTPEGRKLAEDVAKRHAALKAFFIDILKVDPNTAETAACGMEHSVPREIVDKLAMFAHTMYGCPRIEGKGEGCPVCSSAGRDHDESAVGAATRMFEKYKNQDYAGKVTLDAVKPGKTVVIVAFTGDGQIKKRLTEMGLTKGSEVTVERVAPLGDPMDIKIRGYRLSLRKEEAARVVVKDV